MFEHSSPLGAFRYGAVTSLQHARVRGPRAPIAGYLSALGFTLLALVIAQFVEPRLHPTAFFFFFAAVILSAWQGGLGPGITPRACPQNWT